MVDGVPFLGSGPLYTNSWEVGNCSSEDILVALDEMGIETGIDIDKMLQLGRVLEWTMERSLRPLSTKAGRPIKQPVEWNNAEGNIAYIPPYGPPEVYWADPSRYKPASASFIAKQFEGRKLRWDPWEEKVKKVEEEEKGKTAVYSHGGFGQPGFVRAIETAVKRWFLLPKKK
jgi:hydroxymethylglutaryl-CoA lyase